jgi:hypothetical protein
MFEIRAADAPPRLTADTADNDGALLNLIARLMIDDLKLPLPDLVRYAAYGSESAFVEALIALGMSAEPARDAGRITLATAVDRRTRIFARGDLLSKMAIAERAEVYAHELAHLA